MAFEKISNDTNFNFQLNRILSSGDQGCRREDVEEVGRKVTNFSEWHEAWLHFAELAEQEGRYMHCVYYYRMAEFFLLDSDPAKNKMYRKMQEAFKKAQPNLVKDEIPFKNGHLPCIVINPKTENIKGTLLLHGGYDSFIEELYLYC